MKYWLLAAALAWAGPNSLPIEGLPVQPGATGGPVAPAPLPEVPEQVTPPAPGLAGPAALPLQALEPAAARAAMRTARDGVARKAAQLRAAVGASPIPEASADQAHAVGVRIDRILGQRSSVSASHSLTPDPAVGASPTLGSAPERGDTDPPAETPRPEGRDETSSRRARGPPAGVLLERVDEPELRVALERKIYEDPLTGLAKRAWIEDNLDKVVDQRTVVMIVDLDHFKKKVNDAHDHAIGDLALQELAGLLVENAPAGRVAARWGGEEFVLIEDLGREDALAAAEKLRARVEAALSERVRRRALEELGRHLALAPLTISVGMAPILRQHESAHADWIASLEEADERLYDAKRQGRNRVVARNRNDWAEAASREPLSRKVSQLARKLFPGLKRTSVLSGRIRWGSTKSSKPSDALLAQVSDAKLRSLIERRIYGDALTGARNRAHLSDRRSDVLAKHRSVLAIDVDLFKSVNDEHGHGKGDDVLVELVRILQGRFGDAVYRMGGEEFLVFLGGAQAALHEAESVLALIERELGPRTGLAKVTVSAGLASIPESGADQDRLRRAIEAADQALYASKRNGRNRVTLAGAPAKEAGYVRFAPKKHPKTALEERIRSVERRRAGDKRLGPLRRQLAVFEAAYALVERPQPIEWPAPQGSADERAKLSRAVRLLLEASAGVPALGAFFDGLDADRHATFADLSKYGRSTFGGMILGVIGVDERLRPAPDELIALILAHEAAHRWSLGKFGKTDVLADEQLAYTVGDAAYALVEARLASAGRSLSSLIGALPDGAAKRAAQEWHSNNLRAHEAIASGRLEEFILSKPGYRARQEVFDSEFRRAHRRIPRLVKEIDDLQQASDHEAADLRLRQLAKDLAAYDASLAQLSRTVPQIPH